MKGLNVGLGEKADLHRNQNAGNPNLQRKGILKTARKL